MISIQTSHVGSLPFKDINQALDYTFQFDIPVLFTLSQKHLEQFMLNDLVYQLDIGEVQENQVILRPDFDSTQAKLYPPFLEEFLKHAEGSNATHFKYQLVGPYTFYKCLKNQDYSFAHICSFLLPKYQDLVRLLQSKDDFFFVLDEPLLNCAGEDDFEQFIQFSFALEKVSPGRIGLHCCSKLDPTRVNELDFSWINLDISLYSARELAQMPSLTVFGLATDKVGNHLNNKYLNSINTKNLIITPSCGLGLSSDSGALNALEVLRNSKEKLLAAD